MIDVLILLVIVIVVLGCVGLFLRWVMPELGLPAVVQKIVWVVFALLCLLVLVGVLGYGPLKGVRW